MTENKKLYCSSTLTDHDEIDGDFVGGDWRRVSLCLENIRPFIGGRHAHAKFIREQFMDYFENERSFSWQDDWVEYNGFQA